MKAPPNFFLGGGGRTIKKAIKNSDYNKHLHKQFTSKIKNPNNQAHNYHIHYR